MLALLLAAVPLLAPAGQLRIAVLSDLNGSYGSTRYEATVDTAVARLLALEPDLVISTGDMVAGQPRPHLPAEQVERMWDAFDARVSAPLAAAGIPLAVTPGNHDASAYSGFAGERAVYGARWTSRDAGIDFVDRADFPFHYAFAAGDVLLVSVDATRVGSLPAAQMDWLRGVLTEHGERFRWRVVFSHLPVWPVAQGREREFIGDPALQALLEEGRVDLYLSGHHHAFYPGAHRGVAFVSQACLGAGPRRLIGDARRSSRGFTLLEFGDDAIGVAAFEGEGLERAVDWNTLPGHIRTTATELVRADLAPGRVGPLAAPKETP